MTGLLWTAWFLSIATSLCTHDSISPFSFRGRTYPLLAPESLSLRVCTLLALLKAVLMSSSTLSSALNMFNYESILCMFLTCMYTNDCNDYPPCYPRLGLSVSTLTLDLGIVLALFNGMASNMQTETWKGFQCGDLYSLAALRKLYDHLNTSSAFKPSVSKYNRACWMMRYIWCRDSLCPADRCITNHQTCE